MLQVLVREDRAGLVSVDVGEQDAGFEFEMGIGPQAWQGGNPELPDLALRLVAKHGRMILSLSAPRQSLA